MFSKANKETTQQSTEAGVSTERRGEGSRPSIISAGLEIKGDLACDGDVQIEGLIVGDVRSRTLTIGEGGEVRGEVIADRIQVSGTVQGQIRSRSVNLARSARVQGDVLHESLSIEAGAFIEGNVRRVSAKEMEKSPQKEAEAKPTVSTLPKDGAGSTTPPATKVAAS